MKRTLFLCLLLASCAQAYAQHRYYVNSIAVGNNNGLSWANAFPDLQTALQTTQAGDTVWVAQGWYRPTIGVSRSAVFEIYSGVRVYGGFAGTETTLDQRNWVTHPTILSGDIGMEGDSTDNTYNVVLLYSPDSTTVIDGFTIRDGQADGIEYYEDGLERYNSGGGLYIYARGLYAYATIANCTFVQNTALYFGGGAIVNGGYAAGYGSPRFINCQFLRNRAGQTGGGAAKFGGSNYDYGFDFYKCSFLNNSADVSGGGLFYFQGNGVESFDVVGCDFHENKTNTIGAGMLFAVGREQAGYILVDSCDFYHNVTTNGGDLFIWTTTLDALTGAITISNCRFAGLLDESTISESIKTDFISSYSNPPKIIFKNNEFKDFKGYRYLFFQSVDAKVFFENNTFKNIHTIGNLVVTNAPTQYKNCTFYNNSANHLVGGTDLNRRPRFRNCVFYQNTATGGLFTTGYYDTLDIGNCIFEKNVSASFRLGGFRGFAFNSIFRDSSTDACQPCYYSGLKYRNNAFKITIFNASDTVNVNNLLNVTGPLYQDESAFDFRLLPCSSLINAGANTAPGLPATDLAGNPRIAGPAVDIGAYEMPLPTLSASPAYTPACPGGGNGSVDFSLENGCPPYTYHWISETGQTGTGATDLAAGNYQFTLTDSKGATLTASAIVPQGDPLPVLTTTTPVHCGDTLGGSAQATLTGGLEPLGFVWENGTSDSLLTNLAAGSYAVTVTDARGCASAGVATVPTQGALQISVQVQEISCPGAADGSLAVLPLNGLAPFAWQWQGGPPSEAYGPLGPGTYQGALHDALGCSILWILPLNDPQPIDFQSYITPATGEIEPDGSIGLTGLSGGHTPFAILWSNGATGLANTGLLPGAYTVTVTDANGCTKTAAYTVTFTVATNDLSGAPAGRIFPNPTTGVFSAEVPGSGPVTWQVFDGLGRKVLERAGTGQPVTFDLSGRPAGLYCLVADGRFVGVVAKE